MNMEVSRARIDPKLLNVTNRGNGVHEYMRKHVVFEVVDESNATTTVAILSR